MTNLRQPFLKTLLNQLAYLKPDLPGLSLEEREKAYNINVSTLLGVHVIGLAQIIFYLISSRHPFSFLVLHLFVCVLLVLALFQDPAYKRLFILIILVYFTIYGPLLAMSYQTLIMFSMIISCSVPTFMLFSFRNTFITFALIAVETLKIYFIYLKQIIFIIETIPSKVELIEYFQEEVIIAMVGLPMTFCLLYFQYVGYNKNIAAVKKIAIELESSKKTLVQKELLTLSLSHEARNPLHSIIGNLDLAQEKVTDFTIKSMLRKARISADILLYLINNFIDAGKIDTGTLEICNTECALPTFIQTIWATFEELIKIKGLEARLKVLPNIPSYVLIDQNRIAQILYNLISNAIKFTEKGTVTLKVQFLRHERDSAANISMEESEELCMSAPTNRTRLSNNHIDETGSLRFEVIDTGVGISQEDQKNLFEKWNLPDHSSHKAKLGSGLGLWIIKEICNKLDANINVESTLGVGSSFSVYLEVKQLHFNQKPLSSQEIIMKSLGIMIVDDVPFNTEIIANFVKSFGFEIAHTAQNGREAVKIYEQSLRSLRPLKIITMDLEMPLMGGKQACKEIRALEASYRVKDPASIIIISGNSVEKEVKDCLDPNGDIRADYFLRKPVQKSEIRTVMRVVSNRYAGNIKFQKGQILFVECNIQHPKTIEETLSKEGYGSIFSDNNQQAKGMFDWYGDEVKAVIINCENEMEHGIELAVIIQDKAKRRNMKLPIIVGLVDVMKAHLVEYAKTVDMKIENKYVFLNKIAEFVKSLR